MNQALNETGPFGDDPVSEFPNSALVTSRSTSTGWRFEDSDIETTDDLPGRDVYCLPAGWGLRAMTEEMYGAAGLWEGLEENVVNVETGQAASALAEGRAEAFIVYTSNYTQLPRGRPKLTRASMSDRSR